MPLTLSYILFILADMKSNSLTITKHSSRHKKGPGYFDVELERVKKRDANSVKYPIPLCSTVKEIFYVQLVTYVELVSLVKRGNLFPQRKGLSHLDVNIFV